MLNVYLTWLALVASFILTYINMKKVINLLIIRVINLLFGIRVVHIVRFINDIDSLRKKSGIKYMIRYMKTARLHVTRYICNKPLKSNNDLVSLTADYFPKRFLYLKEYVDSHDKIYIRGVLTLFYYTRTIRPTALESRKINPEFDTITKESKVNKFYTIPSSFIKEFISDYNLTLDKPTYDQDIHYISVKSSPYGKATLGSAYGLFSISNVHHYLLNSFIKLIGESSYNIIFGNFIKSLWEDNRLFTFTKETGFCGQLSIVNDPELKLRVIAMIDYNSQILLRPIHDGLLSLLKKFPSDRTYTQDPFNKWDLKGNHFHSLDLSAATDRFPIHLQEKLISYIYKDKEFASAWKEILVNRSYCYRGKSYEYKVGQPMGAYSSWAAFTLCHHLVVHWAYHLNNESPNSYIILGDDIVIANDKVASTYRGIMKKLGVDISIAKTHVSKDTYEFAKRWVKNRVEISPLPLRGIVGNIRNLNVVLMQLINYLNHNNTLYKGSALELIKDIYNNLKINRRFLSKNSINKICYKFYHSYRYSLGISTNREMRNFLSSILPEYIPIPNDELIPHFIRELLINTLQAEVEKLSKVVSCQFDEFIGIYKERGLPIHLLKDHPFTHALYNKLISKRKMLTNINKLSSFDLIDNIVHMRIEEVSKLVTNFRDPTVKVSKLDKLWSHSIKILREINLEFDSHLYRAPNFEVGIFGSEVNESYFKSCMTNSINGFDVLRYGVYNDPTSTNINMYI
nr:putative RNA-dependent RNA polymerase [Leptosphaeria biglobosa mitovirus 9]